MITALAVRYLCYRLRKDKDFWYSYQSNIAMSIYDNFNEYFPSTAKKIPTLHEFCNDCAEDFLKNWTRRAK